jgi:hypothetical protein
MSDWDAALNASGNRRLSTGGRDPTWGMTLRRSPRHTDLTAANLRQGDGSGSAGGLP